MKKIFIRPIALMMTLIILATTLFSVGMISFATSTELTAFNLKVSSTSSDARVMFSLPIDKGANVEFSFDMKVESGSAPEFIIINGYNREAITPTKVEGYRYTFNYIANDSTYNTVQRWYFNFALRTSDVVISNMELYKTDSNYENKLTDNLMKGVYGKNGDFDGWDYTSKFSSTVSAGNILYVRNWSNSTINNADLNGTAVVTKPLDYFTYARTDIDALNLKVNGGSDRTHFAMSLPIATGDYVEFSFDMKAESGEIPKFIVRDNYGNKSLEPVKVEGYKYTFNFQRTKTGDTGAVVRWFFDFTNIQSDVVISNMELYKTDSNYENKEETNLLAGVYGKNGDFDGWSYEDNKVTSWTNFDVAGGKVLCRSADDLNSNRFDGTAVVTKPLDYFTYARTDIDALNLKVNGGSDRTHFAMSLPIATGDYVEFSFDMKAESGEIPKFIVRDNYANKSLEPVKVEGYKYTFNFQRTKTGDTGAVVRWFFDFTNIQSDVVISNMELYKTDSNYENKEETNLLAGVYGKNGDFDGWSYEDNKVTSWTNFDVAGGKVLCRSADDLNSNRFDGTAVVTKPLDYFTYARTDIDALNLKVNGGSDRTHFAMSLPIATGDYVEFSFDMKAESGEIPKFIVRDNYGNKSLEPVKVEGYRYTFNFQRTKTGDTGAVVRWFFDFTNKTSDVVISNMELYKTDSNYENKEETNLLAGVYGKNGDFDGWSYEDNKVTSWTNFDVAGGKVLCRSADDFNSNRFDGTAVVTKPLDYFVAPKTELSALNLKVSSTNADARMMLSLPVNKGSNVEFSFDMKLEGGVAPEFIIVNGSKRETITPTKVEGYRYTFNYIANDSTYNTVQRWYFNFAKRTSDVVISNMELYMTDANYENRLTENLVKGVYGENGDFEGWDFNSKFSGSVIAGNVLYIRNYNNSTVDNADLNGTATIKVPIDYFAVCEAPKMAQIKLNKSNNGNAVNLLLNCKENLYYELSFDMNYEESKGLYLVGFQSYEGTMVDIEPIGIEDYRYTFRFKADYSNSEVGKGIPFAVIFDGGRISDGVTANAYITNISLSEYSDDTYSTKADFGNFASGKYGYGKTGNFDEWNGKVVLEYNKAIATTTAVKGDIWLKSDFANVSQDIFNCEIVNYDAAKFPPIKKMLHIVSSAKGNGRDIQLYLDCQKDKYYEFSFKMKLEDGEIPKFNLKNDKNSNVSILPVKVEGNKYTFNFKAIDFNIANVGQRFILDFDQVLSEVNISSLELYETDSNFKNANKSVNLAIGDNGYGIDGCFSDWNSYIGKDGKGGSILIDNYASSSNKPYFYMEILQMKEGFIDKSTKAGEHMIKFTSYSEESSKAIFFFDCEKDSYYELSFYARRETGDMPTFFIKNSSGAEYDIKPYKVEDCKYTFRFRAQADIQEFVMCFEKKLDSATIAYIVLNKANDSSYSSVDKSNNLAAGINGYGVNGDFDDWNENYTKDSSGLGKIKLDGVGSDKLKVSFTKIPENYFNYKVYSKPQMLHFKHEADPDAERFVLRLNLPNDPDATNYVFSYRLKLKEGTIGYIQTPNPSGIFTTITAAYNYGDTYYFNLKNNAGNKESFGFNFSFTNTALDGYITDLRLYAADGDYNIISEINLASIYGEFMDWSDRGSNKAGGITTLDDSVEVVGLEEWTDGFFVYPEFIPFLNEEENWWLKHDLSDVVDTGIVKGQLKDKSGKVMTDVTIKLSNLFENVNFEMFTDKNGRFEFANVPVGQYSVTVILSDGSMYTFDENIYITNKGDIASLSLVLNENITVEYLELDNSAQEDNTETSNKKVYKKKYYKRHINNGGLPIIAWVGIGVAIIALVGGATVVVILKIKKKKSIL